ncbi:glycosyltransferase family 2 protein [Kocuria rosea]|uniref:glycosyltransferase family 2 protein n=1 Tax=Kocuria rosea TaxID=1275 RepID=UPI0009EB5E72|nr:glycosyltransferase family A protein [Kocuria polaris]
MTSALIAFWHKFKKGSKLFSHSNRNSQCTPARNVCRPDYSGDSLPSVTREKQTPELSVGIVIPTLGVNDCLDATLASIAGQSVPAKCVIVIDQSSSQRIEQICNDGSHASNVIHVRSHTGASHARNVGIDNLPPGVDIVGFLDDDCTYAEDCLFQATQYFGTDMVGAISGRLESHQNRLAFGDKDARLNRKTVWTKAIEATTFCRMNALQKVGQFDESLGIGSSTPWQSGEGTDLLLRLMKGGYSVWYTPSCKVYEHDQRKGPLNSMTLKTRNYARGTGRVYRAHYSLHTCLWQVLRPCIGAVISFATGNTGKANLRIQSAIGRWEGITLHAFRLPDSIRSPRVY